MHLRRHHCLDSSRSTLRTQRYMKHQNVSQVYLRHFNLIEIFRALSIIRLLGVTNVFPLIMMVGTLTTQETMNSLQKTIFPYFLWLTSLLVGWEISKSDASALRLCCLPCFEQENYQSLTRVLSWDQNLVSRSIYSQIGWLASVQLILPWCKVSYVRMFS